MKTMTFHPELTPAAAKARGYLADLTAGAMATLRKVGHALGIAYKTTQRARLASTLAHLTDDQLAQIGIKRTEIWAHVEKITADEVEYDGL
jgi:uncharacterized protein YjiS (DUF1127 family)